VKVTHCGDLGNWCNGNTTDSGLVTLGSNPRSPPHRNCEAKTNGYKARGFCFAFSGNYRGELGEPEREDRRAQDAADDQGGRRMERCAQKHRSYCPRHLTSTRPLTASLPRRLRTRFFLGKWKNATIPVGATPKALGSRAYPHPAATRFVTLNCRPLPAWRGLSSSLRRWI
jgi:hypothetical protein